MPSPLTHTLRSFSLADSRERVTAPRALSPLSIWPDDPVLPLGSPPHVLDLRALIRRRIRCISQVLPPTSARCFHGLLVPLRCCAHSLPACGSPRISRGPKATRELGFVSAPEETLTWLVSEDSRRPAEAGAEPTEVDAVGRPPKEADRVDSPKEEDHCAAPAELRRVRPTPSGLQAALASAPQAGRRRCASGRMTRCHCRSSPVPKDPHLSRGSSHRAPAPLAEANAFPSKEGHPRTRRLEAPWAPAVRQAGLPPKRQTTAVHAAGGAEAPPADPAEARSGTQGQKQKRLVTSKTAEAAACR